MNSCVCLLKWWRQNPVGRAGAGDENLHYSSKEKVDRFVASVIMGLGLIILVAPL